MRDGSDLLQADDWQMDADPFDADGGAVVSPPDRPFPTARGVLTAAEIQALLHPQE